MISLPAETDTRLKGVLFDLDGTLYDYKLCHRKAFKYTANIAGRELGLKTAKFNELYKKSRHKIHKRLVGTAASHSRLLYFNDLVFNWTKKPSLTLVTLLEKTYWVTFYQAMQPYPGVLSLLRALRLKSVKLGLLTDMTAAIQFKKIKQLKLTHMFDVVVTSEEAGCEKPDPEIFRICLERMNVDPRSVVHIGDDFQRDVMGAQSVGLKSILFIPENKTNCHFETRIVKSFLELTKILIPQT